MQKTSIYADFILKNIPRVITQIDRDPHSPTFGCCDRNFWHLKVRDFSSAILQQSGLALAMLYSVNFEKNIYYNNINVRDWAIASVKFWATIQLRDGSFNEYYPYEHGFPPTAFSLFSSSQIYQRLHMDDPNILSKMKLTAKYLCTHIEEKAFNQEIASIAALYSTYIIAPEKWILDGCSKKLDRVLQLQSKEGWFSEYGGADLGYLSVALDMLCEYYRMSGDVNVKEPIARVVRFIKYFVHPDATVGGEYGSRNTTYFLPFGLEMARQMGIEDAAAIKQHLYTNTHQYNFFMDSVDDRYFSHYVLHSFLRALEKEQSSIDNAYSGAVLPFQNRDCKFFSESGLLSLHKYGYTAVVGLLKGGVIKVYDQKKELFIDCGYRVNYSAGVVAATNWQDPSYTYTFEEDRAHVSGKMNKVSLKTPSPLLHMGLRVTSFLFGNKIIGFLKKKLIFIDKHVDILFSREILLGSEEIVINDTITSKNPITVEIANTMSLRHVASGKFFSTTDLLVSPSVVKQNALLTKIVSTYNLKSQTMIKNII